jgi:hypothetical protein
MTTAEFVSALAVEVRDALDADRKAVGVLMRQVEALQKEVNELRARELPPGPQGERGEKGEPGDAGERGAAGERGIDGRDGREGKDGKDGRDGKDGKDSDITRAEMESLTEQAVAKALGTVMFDGRVLRMGDVPLAKLATFQFRGVWAPETQYEPGDTVAWGGQSYVCIEPTADKPDANEKAWKMVARKGRDGKDRLK